MTRRLLVSYLSITLLVLVLLEIPMGIAFGRAERRRLEADVQHDAFALALRAEEALEKPERASSIAELQALADRYQREHGGRAVFVNDRGVLVADGDPPDLERPTDDGARDFASRPEIHRALKGHDVTGQRHSETLQTDLLYVAVPIKTGDALHGAVRVTYPLSFVNDKIRDNWLVLGAVGGVVVLIVLVVSVILARSLSRPLTRLQHGAEALGRGELDRRVQVPAGPHEIRLLAGSFNTTAARLELLVGAQQEFVADASHQLRTPLAALRLRLENLGDDVTPEGRDDLEGAIEEVARLSALVDGLLSLARAEELGSTPEAIDVVAVVEARRDAWAALAEERGVRIELATKAERAIATPGRLEQVLDNLLNNALDVAPVGSAIELAVGDSDDEVRISVSDAGPGMTDDQRERAFDRFWRGERGDAGFGLGLAIVRQLVVADGGTVTLGTSAAGGLAVVLRLSRAPAADDRRSARRS